jgi:hypothetical protein
MKQLIARIKSTIILNASMVLLVAGVVGVQVALVSTSQVGAVEVGLREGADASKGKGVATEITGETGIFRTIVNILLFIVGAIAVIMLVIGGLRYVTSNGDQNAVTGAKNTIMYAIIGIVVAFLAYAAVNFVIEQLQTNQSSTP